MNEIYKVIKFISIYEQKLNQNPQLFRIKYFCYCQPKNTTIYKNVCKLIRLKCIIVNYLRQKKRKMMQDTFFISQNICPICFSLYDTVDHIPMLICQEQHTYCSKCFKQRKNNFFSSCPVCKKTVPKHAAPFRHFLNFQEKIKNLQKIYQQKWEYQKKEMIALKTIEMRKIQQKFIQNNLGEDHIEKQIIYNFIEQGKALFKFNRFKEASGIFQMIIERNPDNQVGEFIGLGSYEESIGYYENNVYQWFEKKYAQSQVSAYDLLALCYLCQPNYETQKAWYDKMIKKRPSNFKLIYGMAVAQHNANKLDLAVKFYEFIIDLNSVFSKPYEMLSFIFLKKHEYLKAFEFAKKCQQLQPSNLYAQFIIAKCRKTKNRQQCCQLLMKLHAQQKEYVRALYQAGFMQKPSISISYWQQCVDINPFYFEPPLSMVKYELVIGDNYQKGIQIANKILQKTSAVRKQQVQQCYQLLGKCFYKMADWQNSIQFLQKYFLAKDYREDFLASLYLAESYYHKSNFQMSKKICKHCLNKQLNHRNFYDQSFSSTLAECYFALKKYDLAIEIAANFVQNYQLKKMHYLLAITKFAMGRFDEAMKWAQICIDNQYRDDEMNIMLVQILQKEKLGSKALQLAFECIEKYQLTDTQQQKLQALINRISSTLVQSKKQALRRKKLQKAASRRLSRL